MADDNFVFKDVQRCSKTFKDVQRCSKGQMTPVQRWIGSRDHEREGEGWVPEACR